MASSSDPIADLIKGLKDYILLIAALVAAVLYLNYLSEKIPKEYHLLKLIIWLIVFLTLVLLYTFNVRPALRKKRALHLRPSGQPVNDYFSTSPREDDYYKFFESGYESYSLWLRQPKASLLYLTGASGSGKSSLINAYLVPRLQKATDGGKTEVFVVRAYHDPMEQLRNTLSPFVEKQYNDVSPEALLEMMHELSALLSSQERILIVLDQFEEFFLLRTSKAQVKDTTTSQSDEIESLGRFFKLFLSHTPKNVSILLSYRDDFQQLIDQLNLPARNEHINFKQVNPLSYSKAKKFLKSCPGMEIPEERIDKVLQEASMIDSPITIRPIVLNILGIILQRMANHPSAWKQEKNLIRQYILDGLGRDLAIARAKLLKLMLTDFSTAKPRSVEELSKASKLDATALDNQLLAMSRYGLVRCLDTEEVATRKRKWQIAHDFIALQLERVVHGVRVTAFHKLRPWIAPVLVMVLLLTTSSIFTGRKTSAINHLNQVGLLWDASSRTISINRKGRNINDSIFATVVADIALLQPDSIFLNDNHNLRRIDFGEEITHIKYLLINSCDSITDVDGIEKLSSLIKLDISDCPSLANIDGLKKLTNVVNLYLRNCRSLPNVEALSKLTALKDLDLSSCTTLNNINGLKSLSNLANLDLSDCQSLTKFDASDRLTRLKRLNLDGCYLLTSIEGLKKLTILSNLDLSYCNAITNIDALNNFTDLKTLKLSGSSNRIIVDGLKNMTALTDLNLSYCSSLTNIDALKNLTALTNLDLSSCNALTSIDALKNLPVLINLDLSNCSVLTNIRALKQCTSLKRINLDNCFKIRERDITDLRRALPKTEISHVAIWPDPFKH